MASLFESGYRSSPSESARWTTKNSPICSRTALRHSQPKSGTRPATPAPQERHDRRTGQARISRVWEYKFERRILIGILGHGVWYGLTGVGIPVGCVRVAETRHTARHTRTQLDFQAGTRMPAVPLPPCGVVRGRVPAHGPPRPHPASKSCVENETPGSPLVHAIAKAPIVAEMLQGVGTPAASKRIGPDPAGRTCIRAT